MLIVSTLFVVFKMYLKLRLRFLAPMACTYRSAISGSGGLGCGDASPSPGKPTGLSPWPGCRVSTGLCDCQLQALPALASRPGSGGELRRPEDRDRIPGPGWHRDWLAAWRIMKISDVKRQG
jgi:hypothetical protein